MRLAGPHRNVRLIVGAEHTRAVVQGIFPPERATGERVKAQQVADFLHAPLQMQVQAIAREWVAIDFGA